MHISNLGNTSKLSRFVFALSHCHVTFLWLFLRQAYTKALGFSSAPEETRRILLSNRAQCYILLGELDAALNDTTLSLSDALTTPESPKSITLKLHYRQAKIYFPAHQYDKASQAFKRFEWLKRGPLTAAEKKLKKDIAGASEGKS